MEVLADIANRMELKARVKIRQPEELKARVKIRQLKELKVFNSLRLPIEDAVEAAAEILMEVFIKLASGTELV